jgi:hypothetical protein
VFPELKSVLKGKHFSDFGDIKSSVKNFWQTFVFRILKTVLDNGRSAGNIVKKWREITLKYSRLLTSASVKIIKKIVLKLPNPSGRTMAVGSIQPLTEMSTRNLPRG